MRADSLLQTAALMSIAPMPANTVPKSEILDSSGRIEHFDYDGSDLDAMAAAANYPRWIIEEFKPYMGKNVAEVGAGRGNFAHFLLETELEHLVTFEPSRRMHQKLSNRFEGEKRVGAINAYFPDAANGFSEAFDSVIYNNVMEHVEDDEGELRAVLKTLKPGGHVLIYVPALEWLFSEFDKSLGHFRRYQKRKGIELLERTGFQVREAKYADALGILPWLVCMKILGMSLSNNSVSLYDRIGIPFTRAVEKIVTPPIGKNLLLIGQKV